MKKRLLLYIFFSVSLTGCFFGEVGSGYLTKECLRTIDYGDIKIIEKRIIKNKDNDVVSIEFHNTVSSVNKENITFKAIKNSYISELNDLKDKGLVTEIILDLDNEYGVSYLFEFNEMSDEIKEKYEFEELNHNQIKKYEEEGYECR